MNRDLCDRMGGDRLGGSSTCDGNPCADSGACCLGTSCTPDMTHDDCEALGGDYAGGSSCTAAPCFRSCCLASSGCEMRDEHSCDALGGIHGHAGETCSPDPCGGGTPCTAALIDPLELLYAIKSASARDVVMSWQADANANAYNTWLVGAKRDIPLATSAGTGVSTPVCVGDPMPDCIHTDAALPASGTMLYYNALGACDGEEASE